MQPRMIAHTMNGGRPGAASVDIDDLLAAIAAEGEAMHDAILWDLAFLATARGPATP